MADGDGLPGVAAAISSIGTGAQAAASNVAALGAAAVAAAPGIGSVAAALKAVAEVSTSVVPGAGQGEQTMRRGTYVDQQVALLQHLSSELARVGGADATGKYGFATIINDIISKVQRGDMTITEALQTLQKQFGAVYGTIQNQFLTTTNPELRALDLALELFIVSGRL